MVEVLIIYGEQSYEKREKSLSCSSFAENLFIRSYTRKVFQYTVDAVADNVHHPVNHILFLPD